MSGDGPIKITTPVTEPLDDIILGEDDETSPVPPVEPKPAPPPPVTAPLDRHERTSARPASTASAAPPPAPPPDPLKETRKRNKLTLRIPDDEVSRPNLPATTPAGGVQALTNSRPPSRPDPDVAELAPMKPQPILAIGSADDTLELPPRRSAPAPAAPGIDASTERGWTPYQPPVSDGVARSGGDAAGNGAAGKGTARETPSVPPASEDIPIETDLDEDSEDLTNPRLPIALDSEEIKLEEGDRVTDPGDLPEVEPDDLVSVESIPTPHAQAPAQAQPPPVKTGKPHDAAPKAAGAVTASSLMAGSTPAPAMAAPGKTSSPGVAQAPAQGPSAPQPHAIASAQPVPAAGGGGGASPAANARAPIVFVPPVGALAPPPMNESAANRKKTRPWWEELFNDDYIRTMSKVTDSQIGAECTFIEESLGCEAGAMILDLACGTGRHAVELARRGYQVVGFDLSLSMLARASDEAQEHGQKINFVQGDMREMTFEETFDGIFSWNTSFGFFDEEKNNAVVAKVHRALKKGGQFLLDVVNRDYIVRQAPSLAWFEGDGCICMDEMQIDFITSRMRVKRTLMMDDGRTKEIEYSVRVYALHELGKMLHDNGFRVAEVSGRTGTPGVFFGCESPRTLILAEKR